MITQKMKNWYNERMQKHIKLVRKYAYSIYILDRSKYGEIINRIVYHDDSKMEEPEKTPYIYITWKYKCENDNSPFEIPKEIDHNQATIHHILNNSHHPEYHQERTEGLINENDRDGNIIPAEIIDATKMDNISIAEMVADWCAMSEERGNTPTEWADKVINKRWKFTKYQENLIYDLISQIWE